MDIVAVVAGLSAVDADALARNLIEAWEYEPDGHPLLAALKENGYALVDCANHGGE